MSIVHIDMDAFFASVEELDRPELKNKPVIVGGAKENRGVVSAANYLARKYGVHSAMPMATANRLCPSAVVIQPRIKRYVELSQRIRQIFLHYTPIIQPLSLDEAFLDLNDSVKLFGPVVDIAHTIKQQIKSELNLTASVGVAPNKFLAKLASDADKPDGFVVVEADKVQAFLDPLPINRLWGVGSSSQKKLQQQAIFTVAHLRQQSLKTLSQTFGENQAQHLWNLSRGIDHRKVIINRQSKSISREITFAKDVSVVDELNQYFAKLTEQVCAQLRQESLKARTISIKLRRQDFKTYNRSHSLSAPTDSTTRILDQVLQLVHRHLTQSKLPLRLVGVGLSNFSSDNTWQGDLFNNDSDDIDELADNINQRFGPAALHRAKAMIKKPK